MKVLERLNVAWVFTCVIVGGYTIGKYVGLCISGLGPEKTAKLMKDTLNYQLTYGG